jgi:hypothetical protein
VHSGLLEAIVAARQAYEFCSAVRISGDRVGAEFATLTAQLREALERVSVHIPAPPRQDQ